MLTDLLRTVRRRVWIVYTALLVAALVAGWRIAVRVPVYRAIGSIQLIRRVTGRRILSDNGALSQGQSSSGELYALKSEDLLRQVIHDVGLIHDDHPGTGQTTAEATQMAAAVRSLRAALAVTASSSTNLVTITYVSRNPQLAAAVVNRLIEDFIDRIYHQRFERVQRIGGWRDGQLAALKRETEASEHRMLELQRQLGLPGFNTRYNKFEVALVALAQQADEATVNRIAAQSRVDRLHAAGADALDDVEAMEGAAKRTDAADPSTPARASDRQSPLTRIRLDLAEAVTEYARLSATLGPNHPQAAGLRARIAALTAEREQRRTRMTLAAELNLRAMQAIETATRDALQQDRTRVEDLTQLNVRYIAAQRQFLYDRQLYTQMYTRLRSATFDSGLQASPIEIVDRAPLPMTPLLPSAWVIVGECLTVGLAMSLVVIFTLENLRGGIRSLQAAEDVLDLPALAAVPQMAPLTPPQAGFATPAYTRLGVMREPLSAFKTAVESVAGTLLFSAGNHDAAALPSKAHIILLTSATPSEGKTTLACNLAVTLARGGTRVLLIDADLRRPNVHHRLGLSGRTGLTTVLSGTVPMANALQQLPEVPALDVLVCGPIPPVSANLIDSAALTALLDDADRTYSYVVIDSPPALAVADVVSLSRQVDAVLLVVRFGKCTRAVVRRARDLLANAGAPLIGSVLNGTPAEEQERHQDRPNKLQPAFPAAH